MTTPVPIDGTAALAHWGLIRARGADTVTFLQSQLTSDVAALAPARAQLSAFCSARGRMQASFVVWKAAEDDVLLACAASVLAATLKRLSMFVLRSKCKLADAAAEVRLHGVAGASAAALLGATPVWGVRMLAHGSAVRLPDVHGVPRAIAALSADAAPPAGPILALDTWRLLEVRSGLPIVEAATVDRFVPQMLNYELVGGVDFGKGCYPGQEVVARSQYRGTIKRRMFMFESDAIALAGQEVFHSADVAQPAGMVVNAAPLPNGAGSAALVEVKLAALEAGSVHLATPDGPVLRRAGLPYSVPSDATQPA